MEADRWLRRWSLSPKEKCISSEKGESPEKGMAKQKRKLTSAEKQEKKRRQKEWMTIFINGKQKRVRRPPTIDGIDQEEWLRKYADPLWLHQNEMWEYIEPEPKPLELVEPISDRPWDEDDLPF